MRMLFLLLFTFVYQAVLSIWQPSFKKNIFGGVNDENKKRLMYFTTNNTVDENYLLLAQIFTCAYNIHV